MIIEDYSDFSFFSLDSECIAKASTGDKVASSSGSDNIELQSQKISQAMDVQSAVRRYSAKLCLQNFVAMTMIRPYTEEQNDQ